MKYKTSVCRLEGPQKRSSVSFRLEVWNLNGNGRGRRQWDRERTEGR